MTVQIVFLIFSCLVGLPKPQEEGKPKTEAEKRAAFDEYIKDRSRWVKLGPVPELKVLKPRMVDEEDARKIQAVIASLARLQSPDFGLSSTMSGKSFSPLGKGDASTMLLTNHELEPSQAVQELVHLGPRAIPFLLKALEDATPTRLEIRHDPGVGGMWLDHELWGNLASKREQSILAKNKQPEFKDQKKLNTYTVKIGDVCFVALGQIVGRGYSAVRYQPTACIVINSPVESPEYRALIREIWESTEPEQALLQSLLVDYSTEGNFNGQSLDGWGHGSMMQCSAAMRLLYYFPEEAAPLIAARLGKLDVTNGTGLDPFMTRELKNGVRTEDFIKAVAWSSDARIRKEVAAIAERTPDRRIFQAATEGGGPKEREVALRRLKEFIAALPAEEEGPYGEGYHLLRALGRDFPDQARPVFESYLHDATLTRRVSVIHVLREIHTVWAIDLLAPMLEERNQTHWSIERVCDGAAASLAAQDEKLLFHPQADIASRDREIEKIKEELQKRKKR